MSKQRKIKHYGYSSFNRRHRRSRVVRVLVSLLVLAALFFLGYCVGKAVLDLSNRPPKEAESSVESSLPQESSELPESSAEISSAESSEPEPQQTGIRSVFLPPEAIFDPVRAEEFLQALDPEICNTVAVPLKDEAGFLSYQSAVPLAAECGAILPNAIPAEQLKGLAETIRSAGFLPAAYLYTLQDDTASHGMYDTSYLYEDMPGVTWLDKAADQGGRSWMNPYMPATGEYLNALTEEITAAGFSRIFAAGLQFPDTRFPQEMGYGPNGGSMELAEALRSVLDGMSAAAEKAGASVIPVFAGEGYLGERDSWYAGSPAQISFEPAAPILPEGRESEVLDAIQTTDQLIPLISAEQLPILGQYHINQYLLRP